MKLKLWSCVFAAAISAQAIAQTASTASSAIPADQALTATNGVTARCMARTTTKRDGHDWTFVVPVPTDRQADFTAKGFQPAACGQLLSQLADHKRFVCEIAKGNDMVQEQTEAQLGIDARKLCAAAKMLLPDSAADQASQTN
jgi:hypothetical protein